MRSSLSRQPVEPARPGHALTTVMYHYVRPGSSPTGFRLHVRTVEEFEHQLDHLSRRYCIVTPDQVLAAAQGLALLPPRACLLTFDDGLKDHLTYVAPRLADRGWSGLFFVPAAPLVHGTLLDVHKLHFVLAAAESPTSLLARVFRRLDAFRAQYNIPADQELVACHGRPRRFDDLPTSLCKNLLQRALPPAVRSAIISDLFHDMVTDDEAAFREELYLSWSDLQSIRAAGMVIGGHGTHHVWLDTLAPDELTVEIDTTAAFLAAASGGPDQPWAMSYPYGEILPTAFPSLQRAGCVAGFTTRPYASQQDWPYLLPRIDTNDLPLSAVVDAGMPRHS